MNLLILQVVVCHYFCTLIIRNQLVGYIFRMVKLILTRFVRSGIFSDRYALTTRHILMSWCSKLTVSSVSDVLGIDIWDLILGVNFLNRGVLLLGVNISFCAISSHTVGTHLLICKMFNQILTIFSERILSCLPRGRRGLLHKW